jgi:hypothetical protein
MFAFIDMDRDMIMDIHICMSMSMDYHTYLRQCSCTQEH